MAIGKINVGGGVDLSFITAEAEHIREGYVGSDTEGNPVYGAFTAKVYQQQSTTAEITKVGVQNKLSATFTMPDFEPDLIILTGWSCRVTSDKKNVYKNDETTVNYVNKTAVVGGSAGVTTDSSGKVTSGSYGMPIYYTDSTPSQDSSMNAGEILAFSSCEYASLKAGNTFTYVTNGISGSDDKSLQFKAIFTAIKL